ncbi:MAG: MFS transporter [Planctomycetota bacterium]
MSNGSKLPLRVQAGYAAADVGMNAAEMVLRLYLLVYYTDVVGLRANLAGLAAGLALVWDAVIDPVMGVVSDRTYRRFGGRRVWLPLGGAMLGLGMVAVFWPPALAGQAMKFTWLLLAYCFLNTGFTILSVPFTAMAGEMTADPHQRSVLFGWRFAFANAGALLAALLPQWLLAEGGTVPGTMPAVSAVLGALALVSALVSHRATAGLAFAEPPRHTETLAAAYIAPFTNRAFRPLVAAYVIANTGIAVNAATFWYYYKHVLRLSEPDTQRVLAVFMAVFTLSIVGWVKAAKCCGKRRPLVLGATVLGLGNTALYVLVPAGGYWWVMTLGAIGLASIVGCVVLIDAMVTDVLDHDQLRTGKLRAGQFFGVWRLAAKLARALALVVVGDVLTAAGFVEQGGEQPASVATALVWLFGPGVGALFLLTGFVLWRYRFDDRAQARVRELLARRAARSPASVPAP